MKTKNMIRNVAMLAAITGCLAALGNGSHTDSPLSYAPRITDVPPADTPDNGAINLFDTRLILPFFKSAGTGADQVALENRLARYIGE